MICGNLLNILFYRSDLLYIFFLTPEVETNGSKTVLYSSGVSKVSVTAAPLERRKGNTQHLLVSTSGSSFSIKNRIRKPAFQVLPKQNPRARTSPGSSTTTDPSVRTTSPMRVDLRQDLFSIPCPGPSFHLYTSYLIRTCSKTVLV